jgi:hypothetical protein
MPPLAELPPRQLATLNRVWLLVLRAYLIIAAGLVLVCIITSLRVELDHAGPDFDP